MAAAPSPPDLLPTTPFLAHASLEAQLSELPAGWDAAKAWRELKGQLPPALRQHVRERAVDAVLEQARRLVRHAARPTRQVAVTWPATGELDVEATLERPPPWAPEDLALTRAEPRDVDAVAILDMSLSMTGEKIALLAVAAAILHMRLDTVAVVAFDTTAHVLVRAGERVGVRELVRRVLGVPAQGYTNIQGGLAAALKELHSSRRRERVGMLFSDGVANVGWDPVPVAGRFPRLHVVHLGAHHVQGARSCKDMARAGRGKLYRARSYADLPGVVRSAVRELFR
jgi:Ca-activated chloride channel family protein